MSSNAVVRQTIGEMVILLREDHNERWASALERASVHLDHDPSGARYSIKRMFGGMGSLNDVVLQRPGATAEKNRRFTELLATLFEQLQSYA